MIINFDTVKNKMIRNLHSLESSCPTEIIWPFQKCQKNPSSEKKCKSGNYILIVIFRLYNIAHRMIFKSIMDFPLYSNIEWYLLMFCRSPMIGESFSGES